MLKTASERFWQKVSLGKDGCLEWIGSRDSNGYGKFYFQKRIIGAHRVAWFLEYEEWPSSDLELDHLCKNILCVNVNHLEAVPPRVNCLRSDSPAARRARQTSCIRGHMFTPENTWVSPTTSRRRCRTCDGAREKLRKMRRVRINGESSGDD